MAALYSSDVLSLAQHLFLPQVLPQGEETEITTLERLLLRLVYQSARDFVHECPDDMQMASKKILKMLNKWLSFSDKHGIISAKELSDAILHMEEKDVIALYVTKQNAGLIIHKFRSSTTFEAFEVLPHSEIGLASSGRLQGYFPTHAVSIPSVNLSAKLVHEIAQLLHKLSFEVIDQVMEKTVKAGSTINETRQKANPEMITKLFMAQIACYGHAIKPIQVMKRIRDECYSESSKLPWRRSGMLNVIHIASHVAAMHCNLGAQAILFYKNFVLYITSKLLERCLHSKFDIPDHLIDAGRKKLQRKHKKLQDSAFAGVKSTADQVMMSVTKRLNLHWEDTRLISSETANEGHLGAQEQDGVFSNLQKHCRIINDGAARLDGQISEHDEENFLLQLDDNRIPLAASFQTSPEVRAMLEVERWVKESLPELNLSKIEALVALNHLLEAYIGVANEIYAENPEQTGVKWLTVMEIWLKVDERAVQCFPLMAEYDPEIPKGFMCNLLLKTKAEMERLIFPILALRT